MNTGNMTAPGESHLPSLNAIARRFHRRKGTVKAWRRQGAPIVFREGRYSADYHHLMAWLIESDKKGPGTSRTPARPAYLYAWAAETR